MLFVVEKKMIAKHSRVEDPLKHAFVAPPETKPPSLYADAGRKSMTAMEMELFASSKVATMASLSAMRPRVPTTSGGAADRKSELLPKPDPRSGTLRFQGDP